jgi:hypothetical protein
MLQERSHKRKIPLVGILAALLLGLLASGVLVFIATASVTGSATLPNGSRVGINTKGLGFGVASNKKETRIEAGGYVVEVDDDLRLKVNGIEVAVLEDEPKDYDLIVNSNGLEMRCAESIVAKVR